MTRLANTELDKVAAELLLFKAAGSTELPPPTHDPSLDAKFSALTTDPRFNDLAFAVSILDSAGGAKTFIHHPDVVWDIGSAGKISILTAALSLLNDVRALVAAGVIDSSTSATVFDDLLHYVWDRHPDKPIKRLANSPHFPQPSRMFDLTASLADLRGSTVIDFAALDALAGHLISPANLATTTFRQRLHLAISKSDNRAARSCQGTLGIGFINATLIKLGLYNVKAGTGMRIAGPYAPRKNELPPGWRQPEGISRATGHSVSPVAVDGQPYAATARSLMALMNAVMTDRFHSKSICDLFRDILLVRPGFSYGSYALEGIDRAATRLGAGAEVTTEYSKIGILWAMADFIHIVSGTDRYSLVILGLLPKTIARVRILSEDRARDLGDAVHTAIKSP
jgi:hypothetical protein